MYNNDLIKILKQGGVVFLSTDTIPGFSCCAFNRLAVEKIYQIKKRNPKSPFIVLVANEEQIEDLGLILSQTEKKMLNGSLGRPTSVVAGIKDKEKRDRFFFLHRGTYYLAVRLIKQNPLRQIILQTGPLVSTSANREGESPILNSTAAEKVFGKKIDYYCEVNEKQEKAMPSLLVKVENGKVNILRK